MGLVVSRAGPYVASTSAMVIARAAIRSSIASPVSTADCIVVVDGGLIGIRPLMGIRKNAETELDEIRELEAPIRNGASGSDIENLLIAISENTRAKPENLDGVRYFFEGCLDNDNEREFMK